jgi:hypothetical protein
VLPLDADRHSDEMKRNSNPNPRFRAFPSTSDIDQVTMLRKPYGLQAAPSKEQVYKVFTRLLRKWPEDRLRPNRSIRSLKPLPPSHPNFDERHYFYQSAAMKVILSNKIRQHVFSLSNVLTLV